MMDQVYQQPFFNKLKQPEVIQGAVFLEVSTTC